MTDAAFDPASLAIEEELVFDEGRADKTKGGRRTPGKRRAETGLDAANDVPPVTAAEAMAAGEPADPPAPVPPAGDRSAGSASRAVRLMLGGALAFSSIASLASFGAVVAVGRSLAAVRDERATAIGEREALARLPAIVATLDAASARLAGRIPAPAPPPATAEEMRHAVDGLRIALVARRPDETAPLAGATRAGFDQLGERLGRIEARLGALGGSRETPAPARALPRR